MPLYRLLQNAAFEPLQIEAMAYAFEAVCHARQLRPMKDDAARELVAKAVIEYAQRGERDPERLRDQVLNALGFSTCEDAAETLLGIAEPTAAPPRRQP